MNNPQHLENLLSSLPAQPGIYQMLDANGKILYVGKAKNLKKRVTTYFQGRKADSSKTKSLMQQVVDFKIIITETENEALLLEANLIKKHRPRYNVLLRDDKSYPYLFLSGHPDFPRLDYYRGAKVAKGRYFGPYPNAGAVRETLSLLQKIFKIRQCSDTFFKTRTRPCIQYQIKRCTAPCVGYIEPADYQTNIQYAILFLEGKNNNIIKEVIKKMERYSLNLDYEKAAFCRDQIMQLRKIQVQQYVTGEKGDIDIIAIVEKMGLVVVQIFYMRAGRLIGNKAYFPKMPKDVLLAKILSEFLPQYYLNKNHHSLPRQIFLNLRLQDAIWIQEALSEKLNSKLRISTPIKGKPKHWVEMAVKNAEQALKTQLLSKINTYKRFEALQIALKLPHLPSQIECFDISHTMGEATVASCVVFDLSGPLRKAYRRFNIKGIQKGDDYAAMQQALMRHYTRVKKEEKRLPDLLIIDGGKGQLHVAEKVMTELQISGVLLMGIAKGSTRKPGMEKLFISQEAPIRLEADSPAFHLLQHVRDEAHRFAITGHRKQRAKTRVSCLEEIPGVGAKRRQTLLSQLGGLQALKQASVEELSHLQGISKALAQRIYKALH